MLKRALDDMKYQNEENMRTLNMKDEEVRFLQKDIIAWKEICAKGEEEIHDLKEIVADVEDKNRKLNEKINEIIYNKASAYKQKTLLALRMGESPDHRQAKGQEYGLNLSSDDRLEKVL